MIDSHAHAFAEGHVAARARLAEREPAFAEMYADPEAKLATTGELLATMAQEGIDGAVVAGFAFSDVGLIREQNEAILSAGRGSRQLIPLASVNLASPGWRAAAEAALADGARGFGELRPGNQGWNPCDSEARVLYAMAREAGAVLLWHVSEPVGHEYAGKRGGISAKQLYRVAEQWPGLRMIAGHLGAELSFFLYMPEARGVLREVYFDTAAWRFLYHEDCIAQVMAQAGAARVLFGSDYPLLSPGRELRRLRTALPADAARWVCGLNAENLFSKREKE